MESREITKPEDINTKSNSTFKVVSIAEFQAESETEIAAEISLPKEGGWGWVVVAASFTCLFIIQGVFLTFASIYKDISEDLEADISMVALINSVANSLLYVSGPIAAALINRFGFRSCSMAGSIMVAFAYLASYFAKNYLTLLLFYGIVSGFGSCFIYMSAYIVVGFYFERLRAIAMAIVGLGHSFGVTIMSFINTYLVQLAGWRTTTLIHSGLFATLYFVSMSFRPLVTLTVVQATEGSREINYLPSLSILALKSSVTMPTADVVTPTATERLFKAPSNAYFPTAAEVLESTDDEDDTEPKQGPSSGIPRQCKITIRNPQGTMSQNQLKQVKSMISRNSFIDKDKQMENVLNELKPKKEKWWKKCCYWERHIDEARPLYRDDAFYDGGLEKLPVYKKSVLEVKGDKTGLEYRMAVSRTVTAIDLREKKGIFTTAVRRILATMMDPQLLKRPSFIMVCVTYFLFHVGIMVPYVFLPDRNKSEGIDQTHCDLLVTVIGFFDAVGRVLAGIIGNKLNPVKIQGFACLTVGIATIASNFSFNVYYQYFYCVIIGAAHAQINTLRSIIIVELYGLDNLTNATGMILLFQGLGSLISTPMSSLLQKSFGYVVSFSVAGLFMVLGGLVIWNAKGIAKREAKSQTKIHLINRKRSLIHKSGEKKTNQFKAMPPIPEKVV